MTERIDTLELTVLEKGLPGVSPVIGKFLAEAIIAAMFEQNHGSGVEIEVKGVANKKFTVFWSQLHTPQFAASWSDPDDSTEHGACGIAMLLILKLTNYTVIRRARKGEGVDYWLGYKDSALFQDAARLEVSGTRSNDDSYVRGRVTQKKNQSKKSDGKFPAYIVVVQFNQPLSYVEAR